MILFPLFFYWIIGATMHHTEGHYDHSAGSYTLLFFAAVAAMASRSNIRNIITERFWNAALSICAALFCYALARKPLMIYADDHSKWMPVFHGLTYLALALSLVMAVLAVFGLKHEKGKVAFRWCAGGAIFGLFAAQCLVPWVSPHPWIDVFVNNTAAVDHFLKGHNPYSQIYPDIYNGRYDYKPGFLYFPGLLYWLAPFRWVFGDIRFGFVFANLLIAIGSMSLARRMKASEPTCWLAPMLWLSFPVVFFVLEQSWIDTILAACAVLTFLFIDKRNWSLAGVFMGLAFAVKQYGFLIGAIAVLQLWKEFGWRAALRATLVGGGIFFAIVLPFALADWQGFYGSTIGDHTAAGMRLDAFNATIYLAREIHWIMPSLLSVAVSLAGMGVAAVLVLRVRKPGLAESATALFLSYGVAFLFGKWAFCNYHYLMASFLLLYLVARGARFSRVSAPSTADSSSNLPLGV